MNKSFRKIAFLTALFVIIGLVLPACKKQSVGEYSAKKIADRIMEEFPEQNETDFERYYSGEPEDSIFFLEPDYAGFMMNGNYGVLEEMESLEEYAFYVPKGYGVFEVIVFKTKDAGTLNDAKQLLQKRLETKDTGALGEYVPDQLELLENAVVIGKDRYAALLATSDNEKAKKIFDEILSGKIDLSEENSTAESESEESGENETSSASESAAPSSNSSEEEPPADGSTAKPMVRVNKYNRNNTYIIGGTCEPGSVISVSDGTNTIKRNSVFGTDTVSDFFVEFVINKPCTLTVTAQAPGKPSSAEITYSVSPQTGTSVYELKKEYGTNVGLDFQCFVEDNLPDFMKSAYSGLSPNKLYTENKLNEATVRSNAQSAVDKLKGKGAGGGNPELIYVVVPNVTTVYPELVPSDRFSRSNEESALSKFKRALEPVNGVTVVDFSDALIKAKNDSFKIFHKTDTHWTQYGALVGYEILMNHIGKKFPAAKPRPRSDFEIKNERRFMGDTKRQMEIPSYKSLMETSPFVTPKFNLSSSIVSESVYRFEENGWTVDINLDGEVGQDHITNSTEISGLPSAYIMRESFGHAIYPVLAERFGTARWKKWGTISLNNEAINEITNMRPDYVIVLVAERNLRRIAGLK